MNINWARINSFITEDDPEEQEWLIDMIQTLIENFDERLVELDEITKNKDTPKLIAMLHQMKGITSNFGLEALRQIIVQAEIFSKANNLESALVETSKLEPVWKETKMELKSRER